ncbi:MAG: VOC family protein [Fulvivirga sp.]
MIIEHIAIWTKDLEKLKNYYSKYFHGTVNDKYRNHKNGFESYFLTFESGARLELMKMSTVPENKNDTVTQQHLGIIHFAFGVDTKEEVDHKANKLKAAGFQILSGPRTTGDGYYEFETLDPDNNRVEVTSLN